MVSRTLTLTLTLGTCKIESQATNSKPTSHTPIVNYLYNFRYAIPCTVWSPVFGTKWCNLNYKKKWLYLTVGVTLQIGRRIQVHLSQVMRKPVLPYANNKGADQPAHPRSLISAFVARCLDSTIPLVSISEISSLYLASVATQASLSLTWSQTPTTGFLVTRPILGRKTLVSRIQECKKRCKLNEPRHKKTCLRGLRPGKPQTDLLIYRDQLQSWNFGYSK